MSPQYGKIIRRFLQQRLCRFCHTSQLMLCVDMIVVILQELLHLPWQRAEEFP